MAGRKVRVYLIIGRWGNEVRTRKHFSPYAASHRERVWREGGTWEKDGFSTPAADEVHVLVSAPVIFPGDAEGYSDKLVGLLADRK